MRYLLLILAMQFVYGVNGQASKFELSLATAVEHFYKMQSKEEHEITFNKFETLSNAYPSEWLPAYYASIVKARMSLLKMGDRDLIADEAIRWVARSKKNQVNDEVLCAESLANSAKMSISPMRRWFSYESRIKTPLILAKKINPNNPRIYVLEATMQHHLPSLFGGGCKSAIPIAQKAEKLLEEQGNNRGHLPRWGIKSIKDILNTCRF